MASAGIRKTPTGRYKVWWRLDDASQGSQSFDTRDQARDFKHDLLARLARGSWVDPRLGKQTFETWAREWWEVWSADPDRSPATLQATEGRLRRYLLPFFGQRQLRAITVSLVRRWQNELRGTGRPRHGDGLPVAAQPHPPGGRGRPAHRRQPRPQSPGPEATG